VSTHNIYIENSIVNKELTFPYEYSVEHQNIVMERRLIEIKRHGLRRTCHLCIREL